MDLRDLEVILFNWISILMALFHFDSSTIITVYYVHIIRLLNVEF